MQTQKVEALAQGAEKSVHAGHYIMLAGLVAVTLFGGVMAVAMTPSESDSAFEPGLVVERLGMPELVKIAPDHGLPFIFEDRIHSGDNVQSMLKRLDLQDAEALAFLMRDDEARNVLRQLRAGRSFTVTASATGEILSLNLPVGRSSDRYIIERNEDGFSKAKEYESVVDTLVEMRSGTITHSLFGATDAAGVPDGVASSLARLFGTQVDFSRDIRAGDSFSVVYETVFDNGTPIRTGRILAAEFVNQGKAHTVVLYREADGNEAYYTPEGHGLNQAFLRYPLEFSRISSGFGRRMHPIHRNWRSHNGTDFAAPTGTPIMASSDGRVDFVGNQRGYGKTIIIQHRDNYKTLYAHLNGFKSGLSKGKRVRQGEVIGYVGQTGWATGPHLHYEIRINNVPHDPMKIALPQAQPLNKSELSRFKTETADMLDRLAILNYQPSSLSSR